MLQAAQRELDAKQQDLSRRETDLNWWSDTVRERQEKLDEGLEAAQYKLPEDKLEQVRQHLPVRVGHLSHALPRCWGLALPVSCALF